MTVRELIKQLQDVDDDVLDYEVYIIASMNLTKDCKFLCKAPVKEVNENVYVENQILYLKANND